MKNIILLGVLALVLSTVILSCKKLIETPQDVSMQTQVEKPHHSEGVLKKKYIWYAAWDPGRPKHNCTGVGFCNFVSCAFCCVENEEIVDCNTSQTIVNSGIVTWDDVTLEGNLIFKLNPSDSDHQDMINNESTLYIDDDIVETDFTVLQGQYQFDSEIGSYGGYQLDIIMN